EGGVLNLTSSRTIIPRYHLFKVRGLNPIPYSSLGWRTLLNLLAITCFILSICCIETDGRKRLPKRGSSPVLRGVSVLLARLQPLAITVGPLVPVRLVLL